MASGSPTPVGVRVADGVGLIPGFVNCYTYLDGEELLLIDTGAAKRAGHIVRTFERSAVPLDRVRKILLTHHHVDHMGGAAYLVGSSHAAVACHSDDAPYVDGRVKAPMPLLLRLFMRVHPAPVALPLKDGDMVGPLRVVHTPGHTPGEVVFYEPTAKLLFAGDALREHKGALGLPGTRYASNLRQAVESLKRLQALDVRRMLPGHGQPVGADFPGLLDDLIRRAPREFLGA
jgi:glyoxylase-like metal-dependent hydrolase (beta-lactamase superfamily II)